MVGDVKLSTSLLVPTRVQSLADGRLSVRESIDGDGAAAVATLAVQGVRRMTLAFGYEVARGKSALDEVRHLLVYWGSGGFRWQVAGPSRLGC